jgi:uncharacterized membrane protein YedE/YeeE
VNARVAGIGLMGLVLGTSLGWIGFADWREVHRMFVFADLRLLYTFAGGALLTGAAFWLLRARPGLMARPIQRGTLLGGMIFGVGWGVTGACPGAALVMLGQGSLMALAILAGIGAGMAGYLVVQRRWLRWPRTHC